MIKALWFFAKIALVIAVVIWVAERPGTISIDWLDYRLTMHVGLFLVALLAVLALAIFLYRALRAFVDFPAAYRYYAQVKGREKGYEALTIGLSAVAAGDTKTAVKQSERAQKLLPDEGGLPLLLAAQAARLDGREDDANRDFTLLLEDKNASFLGVRGLLQAALDRGDDVQALALAEQALEHHPKQGWIVRTLYDVQIRLRRWSDAKIVLERAVKASVIEKAEAQRDKIAIALALAEEAEAEGLPDVAEAQFRTAARIDAAFAPRVIREVEYWLRHGQSKKAQGVLERAWKRAPHPTLVALWQTMIPAEQDKDALSRLKWLERLLKKNPESAAAQMAAGLLAIDGGLWGEARRHLEAAETIRPSAALYRAFAALEDKSGGGEDAARASLDRATDAPLEKAWICRETGQVYESWAPIAAPHGAFNTIEWAYPNAAAPRQQIGASDSTMLEAPKVA